MKKFSWVAVHYLSVLLIKLEVGDAVSLSHIFNFRCNSGYFHIYLYSERRRARKPNTGFNPEDSKMKNGWTSLNRRITPLGIRNSRRRSPKQPTTFAFVPRPMTGVRMLHEDETVTSSANYRQHDVLDPLGHQQVFKA